MFIATLYKRLYSFTNELALRYRFINTIIRFINVGRILWLLEVLKNSPKIKDTFINWPTFILDCFGFIRKGTLSYVSRSGVRYKIRTHTIDVGVLYEVVVMKNYMVTSFAFKKGDIVIDIGSHIGSFSLLVASLSKIVTIYAIEPQKDNFKLLCENIKMNKIKNIIPLNTAILSTAKKINFYENKNNLAGHTFFPHDKSSFKEIKIQTTTLDALVNKFKIKTINLLKMDCEGSEYDILLNCSDNTLKKKGFRHISISQFPVSILYCSR